MTPSPPSPETIELWREADRVFDGLLDLQPTERRETLQRLDPAPGVRERVEQLLQGAEQWGPRFEQAALRFAADLPEAATTIRPGMRVGRWVLDEELGRGGMSVVFAAHDPQQPERRVAIKLLAGVLAGGSGQHHLHREQQALSRLSHPLIVPLIEAGALADGTRWLAMARVDGKHIDAWCIEQRLDVARRVELMAEVADAVAHAHRALVVHRDLKPANVLIDTDGRVRLLDFGIAGILDPGSDRTRTLMQALTPAYAAPEQFEDAPASTTIDVYGLGALLHRLLTGSPPARRSDADAPTALPSECVQDNAFHDIAGREHARGALRGDLDAILLKALEHDPARRYPGAGEFAADLRAWLDGRPVSAQRPTLRYRVGKFVRRHRSAVSVAATAAVAVLVALGIALWQSGRAAEAARVADLRATEAARESARAEAVSAFLVEIFGSAAAGAPRNELPSVQQLLDAADKRMQEAFLGEPDTRARLLLALGEVQISLGRLDRADRLLSEALALISKAESPPPLKVAHIETELAVVRLRRGDLDSALALSAAALARLPPIGSSQAELRQREHVIDVRTGALTSTGRLDEAEALTRAHWDGLRALPEVNPELLAGAAYSLAIALNARGPSEEALELLELAREHSRDFEGGWELRLSVSNALASALSTLRRYNEALAAREEALEMVTQGYPPGHVRIGQTLNNLASDLISLGRTEESLVRLGEALAILEKELRGAHPTLASVYNNHARALADLGRHEEASADFARAETILAAIAPASDPRLQSIRLGRADALIALGRLDESAVLLRGLDAAGAGTAPDAQRATLEIVRARLQAKQGALGAAESSSLTAAEAARKALPDGSGLAALALGQAAAAAAARGDLPTALQHFGEADAELVRVGAGIDRSALRYLQERHATLLRHGRRETATALQASDLARLRALLPADDPRLQKLASIDPAVR